MAHRGTRRPAAAAIALLVACGGGQRDPVPRLPGAGAARTDAPATPAGPVDAWSGRELLAQPGPMPAAPLALPPIERFTLPSGLEVISIVTRGSPMVTFQLAIRAGRRDERPDAPGLATVAAAALIRGSARRSRLELDRAAEAVGASLSTSASFEATLLGCSVPAVDAATCGGMLGELVARPALSEAVIDEVRKEVAATHRQARLDGPQLANLHLQNLMWGSGHARGRIPAEATLLNLPRAEVVAWHRDRVRPNNAVLLVVGDIERARLEPIVRQGFAGWSRGKVPTAPAPGAPMPAGLSIRLVDSPAAVQAQIRVGLAGLGHRDPDLIPMTVIGHALGGSPGSRLSSAVRAKLGPASAASASFDRNLEPGAIVLAGVAPSAQAVTLVRILLDQLAGMAASGPSTAEVGRAAAELVGGQAVAFDSVVELGNAVLTAALHGLGEDDVSQFALRVAAVDREAARAVAARRLASKDLAVVIVGDGAMIGRALTSAGLKFERVRAQDPVGAPAAAPPDPRGPAPAAASPAEQLRARKIVEAALVRKGGLARIRKLSTLRWKGDATLTLEGKKMPAVVEKRYALPDRLRLDMVLEGGNLSVATVLAGQSGWARQARGGEARLIDFPAAEVSSGLGQIWRDPDLVLTRHHEPGVRLAVDPDLIIDGAACDSVRVTTADGKREVVLHIDKKTRQLRGMQYAEQGQSAEERYRGFKRVAGLEIAHERSTRSSEVDLVTRLTEVVVDGPIDPGLFARPER